MGEFELIRRYFQHGLHPPGVALGNGDDAALLRPALGCHLAVSTDMLVEGRHFVSTVPPEALGHKALAVNLSDMAAMGAQPLAFTLALSLPHIDEAWLAAFSRGLLDLADRYGCALVGGDTTSGPLAICITVMGEVPVEVALRRSGGCVGDDLYVSGGLGDARLALDGLRGHAGVSALAFQSARPRLDRPEPRVALGHALRGVATACADVSDGLLGDLAHILTASGTAAQIDVETLLASSAVSNAVRHLAPAHALTCVLAGGDDYELVFTAPSTARAAVVAASHHAQTPVTRIGQLTSGAPGTVRLVDAAGGAYPFPDGVQLGGFDHFAR